MRVKRYVLDITTAADGTATVYTPTFTARVLTVSYVKTDMTSPSFTITAEATAEPILSLGGVGASFTWSPRKACHDLTGTERVDVDGIPFVTEPVTVVGDRMKVVVTGGGATKTGKLHVMVDDVDRR